MQKPAYILLLWLFLVCAWSPSLASPLFNDSANLELTIEAPFREIIRKRQDKTPFTAVIRYTDSAGQQKVLRGQVMARGNSRLDACDFPPLRLVLDERDTADTVFAGQVRLKMVTQCKKNNSARRWLLQELGIYRAYNVISEFSYRVRRLEVQYIDSESKRWRRVQPAFFIEDTSAVAERVNLNPIRPPEIKPEQLNKTELANYFLFQLLIANTDFSVKRGTSAEGCCHNGRVLARPGSENDWVVLPYDFDQAGLINTSYALPDRRLGIRSVTNRLYRGFCWHNDALPGAITRFVSGRKDITEKLIPEGLPASQGKRAQRFVDGFYRIIEDPQELNKKVTDKCRGAATFSIRKTRT